MTSENDTPDGGEPTVDERINRALRAAVEHRGDTLSAFGRRLDIPASTWARKISDRPSYHQSYRADEVERIAHALGLTPNDLYSGNPILVRVATDTRRKASSGASRGRKSPSGDTRRYCTQMAA